jgi:glutamate racemase
LEIVGEGLVPLIESNRIHSDEMTHLLKKYTKPMLEANIDYLVLGCTHYPYLIDQLKKLLPPEVQILDSGLAVAKHTENTLASLDLLRKETNKPTLQFYTNANADALTSLLKSYAEDISISEKDF